MAKHFTTVMKGVAHRATRWSIPFALILTLGSGLSSAGCELFTTPIANNDNQHYQDTQEGGDESSSNGIPDSDYCAPVKSWSTNAARFEEEIVTLVNQHRAAGANCGSEGTFAPAGPLQMNAHLRCAARIHALDMATRDFFDHVNPEGQDPGDRIGAAGFSGNTWGENIAAGSADAAGTIRQWMESDGHCANIMHAEFNEIGVGYAEGGTYRYVWAQTFGG